MHANKIIRYLIVWNKNELNKDANTVVFYKSYKLAEEKRLFLSEKEGKVYKVAIELSNGVRNGKKTNRRSKS